MTPDNQIKLFLLRAVHRCGDRPMPETVLRAAAGLAFRDARSQSELGALIRQLEAEDYLVGVTDDLAGLLWVLTAKGKARLLELGA